MLFHMRAKIFTMVTKQKMDDRVGGKKKKQTYFEFSKWYFPWKVHLTPTNMNTVNTG